MGYKTGKTFEIVPSISQVHVRHSIGLKNDVELKKSTIKVE